MAKRFELNVNGQSHAVESEPDMPLLYALRDDLGMKEPRFGCGLAQCGACTVLVDGEPAFTQAVAAGPLQRALERAQARRADASS